jgi:7-cyano-7-deazaguanine synthase
MDYVLLSGGLDSTVLLASEYKSNKAIKAIYVNHGQKGSIKELSYSQDICQTLGVKLKIIDISSSFSSFSDVIDGRPGIGTSSAIALNSGLLMAINWIAWAGGKSIAVGIHKDDLDGRPWLFGLFSKYMEGIELIRPSLTGIPPRGDEFAGMSIHFPFKDKTKSDIVNLGAQLGVDLSKTMTCQFDDLEHCGTCYLCEMRRISFSNSTEKDPTSYKST